jgi:hypothetical protein
MKLKYIFYSVLTLLSNEASTLQALSYGNREIMFFCNIYAVFKQLWFWCHMSFDIVSIATCSSLHH